MQQDKNTSNFLVVLIISLVNILLAYIYSKSGYEAFITVSIALGLLFTLLSISSLRLIFRSSYWLIVKLIFVPLIAFMWFMIICGVMLSVSPSAYSPNKSLPDINWWIVIIGTLPYLLPRLNLISSKQTLKHSIISMLYVLYSVMVLLIAAISFHSPNASEKNIMLILGIQLQYLMNYAVLKTNYLEKSLYFSNKTARKFNIHNNDLGTYFVVIVVGLPFILPLAVVLIASSLR